MPDEGEAQQLALQFEQGQRRLQALDQHLARLEQSVNELQRALATLEGLDGATEGPALVPVGAGLRLHATVDPTAEVVLDVGSGYSVGLSAEDAASRLRDRLAANESAFRATSQEADRIANEMEQIRARLTSA